ncbi:hypothetical protein [Dokdonella soli]|uniref:Uncharacterized protein n=1 Tax=Dokdonella soli TaxID=529810 RepID=A0ABN1IUH0_9GAMM
MTDDLIQRLRPHGNPCEWAARSDVPDLLCLAADEIERLRAEVGRMRAEVIASLNASLTVIQKAREWQEYAERIERDTDAAMAEEIQRLRRDKPRAEASAEGAEAERDEYREVLRDLCALNSEEFALTGGGPGIKERLSKAWERAHELTRIEP